ncbi:MAG: HepT-like ribonuclease domain-containing protein [Candidatus Marinimicrobia bacterium]|nr:HepT-like ribonuclease domain-containing protein [Candidatus Neomarinimicrobiota bacterium]
MYNKKLLIEVIEQILNAITKIEKRFDDISLPDDFLDSDNGMNMLDAICMQLIAIGESVKNIDKISDKKLLIKYPEVDWKGIMGVRDIISHHYFDIDAEVIFNICDEKLGVLSNVLNKMLSNIKK